MKIAILGTRGIPNNHGGFEQFAEHLAKYLVERNHEVFVYNSNTHPYKENYWNGVNILHKFDPEDKIGTVGQFIYDFFCIRDSKKRNFDLILQLGYTSSSIWNWLFSNKTLIVTNMDGLEWKRSKYNKWVQYFLKYAEKLAVRKSDFLIADSKGIQTYLSTTYGVNSEYIAYGARIFNNPQADVLDEYNLKPNEYNLLIARLEPENNIETILDGLVLSNNQHPFLVIGKTETKFGLYLKNKFKSHSNILFLGGIYNQSHLNNLRYYSNLYFHGHSVGGTNPSLLEAMASNTLIVAHNNVFNKSILGEDAFYFENVKEVTHLFLKNKKEYTNMISNNTEKILSNFEWNYINSQYEEFLIQCLER